VTLDGRKVLIVGGSKGIGRATALRLSESGAHVAIAARTADLLDTVIEECHGPAVGFTCDIRESGQCEQLVSDTVAALGGIDALVYSSGTTAFAELAETTADEWRAVFETNVIGAALCTGAAIPYLEASGGHAIYFSSNAVAYHPPWVGIGAYVASKLALESCVRNFQEENPGIAFTALRIGPTVSEFRNVHAGGARFGEMWVAKGVLSGRRLEPDEHARTIAAILSSPARVEIVTSVPR
jgi:NAD(P)-dependent dehydrogenase (short-subunit alcohol dehydrogenase family)